MSPLDAERGEQTEAVVGHVPQCVGRHRAGGRDVSRAHGVDEPAHVDGVFLEPGGQPAVAVVVPDHVASTLRERAAEVLVPGDHLGAETHHEQDSRISGVTEGLVLDGHSGQGFDKRHAGSLPAPTVRAHPGFGCGPGREPPDRP